MPAPSCGSAPASACRSHLIHPAGFALSDRNFKRAGMDYLSRADLIEHADWEAFEDCEKNGGRRLIALSARAQRACPISPSLRG